MSNLDRWMIVLINANPLNITYYLENVGNRTKKMNFTLSGRIACQTHKAYSLSFIFAEIDKWGKNYET